MYTALLRVAKNPLSIVFSIGCYLVNRSPSTAIDSKTPMELWSGK